VTQEETPQYAFLHSLSAITVNMNQSKFSTARTGPQVQDQELAHKVKANAKDFRLILNAKAID